MLEPVPTRGEGASTEDRPALAPTDSPEARGACPGRKQSIASTAYAQ